MKNQKRIAPRIHGQLLKLSFAIFQVADQTHSRRKSTGRRGAAAGAAAPHQYQAGPNLDDHTIEIPAADQPHAGLLVGMDSLKTAHHALLDSQ